MSTLLSDVPLITGVDAISLANQILYVLCSFTTLAMSDLKLDN